MLVANETFTKNREELKKNGYTLFPGLLSSHEIQKLREACLDYFNNTSSFIYYMGGKTQSDAMSRIPGIRFLLNHEAIVDVLKGVIGDDVRFLHHSDAHLNMLNGWHKDITGYVKSPWEKREGQNAFGIYKIAFYLQDHLNDNNGFSLRKGSHLYPDQGHGEVVDLHTRAGDALLFDQRLDHVGQQPNLLEKLMLRYVKTSDNSYTIFHRWRHLNGVKDKMSVFMGFGNSNAFSLEFTNNVIARQNRQNQISNYTVNPDVASRLDSVGIKY